MTRAASTDDMTVDGWLARMRDKEAVARAVVDDKKACREAWQAAGTGVEFTLKAVIMRKGGFNRWPDKESRPDLYVHDLRSLMASGGIDPRSAPRELRGRLKTVLDWDRAHDYVPGQMQRRQARTMVDAAFGADGVIQWLMSL